ncbi:alanine racemase [Ructibacterium gallinarum]|uniref:Alanine racemase n=1 Tax=Ructibacterium gallinarum TaxID=2779355 RepID=A0A9D5LXV1_9FIRM|nr:alanine racemase [Ructibacterium gallinarum]MBE5038857.1 alanine racemase [Ructibacterium gallinarum]
MIAEKRAWAEISLDAIENNISRIREYVRPQTKILGVVKADAYGHGYLEVAKTLLGGGADSLAVACIDEAVQLRRCGIQCPILILGHTANEDAGQLVEEDIIPSCFSYELASCISRAAVKRNKRAKIHIKIDTGMSRVGFRYTEDEAMNQKTVDTILKMAVLPNLDIDGIFTHFSVADEKDDDYTYLQFKRFQKICDRLQESGLHIPLRHCCNSAALIRFPEMHMDMVRPGIILYGLQPSSFVDCSRLHLQPAMQFKARITNLKEVEAGVSVSYGRKFKTEKVTKIATVPVGYADGYSRILSQKAQMIAGNQLCNIVGNICMDQCMIDVTNVNNIAIGDDVILFGKSDDIELPVESLAEKMGTINYEILCVIGKRIPRVYFRGGKVEEVHNYLLDPPVSV